MRPKVDTTPHDSGYLAACEGSAEQTLSGRIVSSSYTPHTVVRDDGTQETIMQPLMGENAPYQKFRNTIIDSYVRPHEHKDKWEEFEILKGEGKLIEFAQCGKITKITHLKPSGVFHLIIPNKTFHTFVALENGTTIQETKPGTYNKETDKNFPFWAPAEQSEDSLEYLRWLKSVAKVGDSSVSWKIALQEYDKQKLVENKREAEKIFKIVEENEKKIAEQKAQLSSLSMQMTEAPQMSQASGPVHYTCTPAMITTICGFLSTLLNYCPQTPVTLSPSPTVYESTTSRRGMRISVSMPELYHSDSNPAFFSVAIDPDSVAQIQSDVARQARI